MDSPTVTVVMPVRNGGAHVRAALATMVPQAHAAGGDVIVVDDASDDASAADADAAGARVIRLPERTGPYAARNEGWRATGAPVVVFTDVRNRAEPGWLERLVAALADPAVAIAGGTVRMGGGNRVAERWARHFQLLDVGNRLGSDWLPYVPTASMAVRRTALEAVDGFRPVRSAGDVDLCWRVQLAGLGRVVGVPDSVMTCDPRDTVREVLDQWTRYGYSNFAVRTRFGPEGCPPPVPRRRTAVASGVARALGGALLHRRDIGVALVDQARMLAYERSFRRANVHGDAELGP